MRFYERFFVLISLAAAVFVGASCVAHADGLLANWTMNDPVGSSTVADESGNGHTGTLPTAAGATATLGVPGIIGTAVSLPGNATGSGAGYYISVPASSVWGGQTNMTYSAWVEFNSMPSLQYIFNLWPANSDDSSQAVLRMGVPAIPAWQAAFYSGSNFASAGYSASKAALSTNTWHLITGTWNGDPGVGGTNPNGNGEGNSAQSRLYLDGVYMAENETLPGLNYGPFAMNSNPSLSLAIGGGNQEPEAAIHEWNGDLNDLGLWNVTLTDAEVAALYNTPMYNSHTGAPVAIRRHRDEHAVYALRLGRRRGARGSYHRQWHAGLEVRRQRADRRRPASPASSAAPISCSSTTTAEAPVAAASRPSFLATRTWTDKWTSTTSPSCWRTTARPVDRPRESPRCRNPAYLPCWPRDWPACWLMRGASGNKNRTSAQRSPPRLVRVVNQVGRLEPNQAQRRPHPARPGSESGWAARTEPARNEDPTRLVRVVNQVGSVPRIIALNPQPFLPA